MSTGSSHPNEDDEPRGMGDSDPVAVREIIAMEEAIYAMYNKEFLTQPDAPLRFYADRPDNVFFDLLSPGEYHGEDIRKYFNFIGPQFVGRMEGKEIKVWVKGDTGFVVMKQHYYGKDADGNSFHWIMRQTDGVIKENDHWKIAHTHYSWPMRPADMTADLMSTPAPMPWDQQPASP